MFFQRLMYCIFAFWCFGVIGGTNDDWNGKVVIPKHPGVKLNTLDGDATVTIQEDQWFRALVVVHQKERLRIRTTRFEGWVNKNDVVPLETAVNFFTARIQKYPKDNFAYMMRGLAHYQNGESERALKDYDEAIWLRPNDPTSLLFRGLAFLEEHSVDAAMNDFDQALRIDSHSVAVLMARGATYLAKRQQAKAIRDLDAVIEVEPGDAAAYINRGSAHYLNGEFVKALEDFNQAIKLDQRLPLAYVNRGLLLHEWKKDYEKAVNDFAEAIKLDPSMPLAFIDRASSHFAMHDYDRSIADYDEAIKLDPKSSQALTGRGWAYQEGKKDYERAIRDHSEAIRLNPGFSLAYLNRAAAYLAKKEYAKAIGDYEQANRVDPNFVNGYNWLARLLATCPDDKVRDGQKALTLATKACALTKWENGHIIDTLAAAYAELGQFEDAVKWELRALECRDFATQNDKNARARLQLYQHRKPYRDDED